MFNVSEEIPVKARHRQAAAFVGTLAGLALGSAPLFAQSGYQRPVDPNAPVMVVLPLRSTEKGLGCKAQEAIQSRLTADFGSKQMTITSKQFIDATLKASGFPECDPLAPSDARALAQNLRGDEILDGTVTKTSGGYRIDARLMLVGDVNTIQPLGSFEGNKLDNAAKAVINELKAARGQLASQKECTNLARQGKYTEAATAARAGTSAYPKATLTRACAATAFAAGKMSPDSVLRAAQEILAIDANSRVALTLRGDALQDKANTVTDTLAKMALQDSAVESYTRLLANNPRDTRLAETVVRFIAGAGKPELAVPIIDTVVQNNPGDPSLERLQWRLLLAARDYKRVTTVGEELVRLDTAQADTSYFLNMSSAYASDSQPQKAAEVLARGIAKFPTSDALQVQYVQTLRAAGQTQQAAEKLRAIIARNPKVERGYLSLAQLQADLNQPDSALASLRMARTNGDTSLAGQIALVTGNNLYKAKNYVGALPFLSFGDSTLTSRTQKAQAKFLLGVSNLQIASGKLQDPATAKSCPAIKDAQAHLVEAQINVPAGGVFDKAAAGQAMQALQQLTTYADAASKRACK
jgi:tetratricopeptide (TPR) repeat protein